MQTYLKNGYIVTMGEQETVYDGGGVLVEGENIVGDSGLYDLLKLFIPGQLFVFVKRGDFPCFGHHVCLFDCLGHRTPYLQAGHRP